MRFTVRELRKLITEAAIPIDVNGMVLYRGSRSGDPSVLTGPSYFISSEIFAKINILKQILRSECTLTLMEMHRQLSAALNI